MMALLKGSLIIRIVVISIIALFAIKIAGVAFDWLDVGLVKIKPESAKKKQSGLSIQANL